MRSSQHRPARLLTPWKESMSESVHHSKEPAEPEDLTHETGCLYFENQIAYFKNAFQWEAPIKLCLRLYINVRYRVLTYHLQTGWNWYVHYSTISLISKSKEFARPPPLSNEYYFLPTCRLFLFLFIFYGWFKKLVRFVKTNVVNHLDNLLQERPGYRITIFLSSYMMNSDCF